MDYLLLRHLSGSKSMLSSQLPQLKCHISEIGLEFEHPLILIIIYIVVLILVRAAVAGCALIA